MINIFKRRERKINAKLNCKKFILKFETKNLDMGLGFIKKKYHPKAVFFLPKYKFYVRFIMIFL